jgi:glycosyltransferase involved in cell wall biosynthesis
MPRRGSIAINAAIVGDQPTGLGVYARNLVQALAALDEPLLVFTSRADLAVAKGVDVRPVSAALALERGALGHLARLAWVQTSLRLRVRSARPRVLLNVVPEGVLASAVPQVTIVHDVVPLHAPSEYPRQQLYFRRYVPAVLRASRAVIAISESTRRDLLRFYDVAPEKVRVVLSGYDRTRFVPDDAAPAHDAEPYVLYVGNVMPHKNLGRLVEAFAMVARQVPVRLRIRGWGRARHVRELQAQIHALGLEPRVDWQPYAGHDELPALYRGARALALPSLHEGFGLTALEAMACGTPVVTSNVSSMPEVVGDDAALLVDPHDTPAMADNLLRLVVDDALRKELRERGLTRASQFSWQRTANGVVETIDSVLTA